MYFCFVDESGGFEAPASNPAATPLMTLAGLIIDSATLPAITTQLIQAKMRFFPGKSTSRLFLDHIRDEVKGSDLRTLVRSSSRRDRRHVIGYLDRIIQVLNVHNIRLVGRVWIKPVGQALDPDATYTYAIQDIARHFHAYLDANNQTGLLLCDSRMHNQNAQVSHSVFTQKHAAGGDPLPRIPEAPVFGASLNHAGLQLADAVASALIFPIASRVYCAHQWPGSHTNAHFEAVRQRYAAQLRAREFRYQDHAGRTQGGIVVSDRLRSWPSSRLFRYP